ncbi:MAG: hypothetical protein K8U57_40260 [Planctomycetes bacterium]|nr:hypothetical protein [Planctomycetota bacterium]
MKEYPSILGPDNAPELPCIAFRKYDGSNLRFAWKRGKGWCQFGTRRRLFKPTDPEFGCAIELFQDKYAAGVEKVIYDDSHFRNAAEVICFCEFFGPHSFAGAHDPNHSALKAVGVTHNDPKDVVLFDVNVLKKGLMPPRRFLDTFGHLPVAEVIYEGDFTAAFVRDVREGKFAVGEGVICKGVEGPAPHGIWMRKVKTLRYLEELKRRFASDWQGYWE